MYFLGYDIGSSSIKAALIDSSTMETIDIVNYPETEMDIIARHSGWAEQQPEVWWENIIYATNRLFEKTGLDRKKVLSIGISYQMHGLVLLNNDQHVLRPAIIWCDSRAVGIGEQAFEELEGRYCLKHLLNSPGNFTASKLKWVKDHEPDIYQQIHKILLPGDFINFKLTGELNTTISGLSEGVFWDFEAHRISDRLMHFYGFDDQLIPEIVDTFSVQGKLSSKAAEQLGLAKGTIVGYRAGDQPNNALSLNVFQPGEIAATGGTSGVVYGISDELIYDEQSRVNGFAHVNHTKEDPRIGILLCINGAGIQYSWMRQMLAGDQTSYFDLERLISSVPVNSDGLMVFPFGNGAERMFQNQDIGSRMLNVNLNRHGKGHMFRAALEGIAFSFIYGMEILKEMGMNIDRIKVGNDNLFQSNVFSKTISSVLGCEVEMLEATGAVGAAKAGAVGAGYFKYIQEAIGRQKVVHTYSPGSESDLHISGYGRWKAELQKVLNSKRENIYSHEYHYRG